MSAILKYRVNHADITDNSDGTEFYLKIDQEDGSHLCNFCISDVGIYYYKPRSKILSPKETARARRSTDSYISMEDLKDLLEVLRQARLVTYEEGKSLKITRQGRKVILEAAPDVPDE